MLIWFHSFSDESQANTEAPSFEAMSLSVFQVAHQTRRAKKLFSGDFNGLLNFLSQAQVQDYREINVLLPANEVLLTQVAVPSSSRHRIMQALPFLLDESLITLIDTQYFALGHRHAGQCQVAVVSDAIIKTLYEQFKVLSLPVSSITSELFELPFHQGRWSVCFLRDKMLIRTGAQSGLAIQVQNIEFTVRLLLNHALPDKVPESAPETDEAQASQSGAEAASVSTGIPESITLYAQENKAHIKTLQRIADDYLIATQVVNSSLLKLALADNTQNTSGQDKQVINLLQGHYHAANLKPVKIPYRRSLAAIFTLWLVTQLAFMGYQWQHHSNELSQLDAQLEALYFKTFPDSKRIIDVRAQTQSQLNQLKKQSASSHSFLGLLGLVGEAIRRDQTITIRHLRYNDGVLQLDMSAKDFVFNRLKSVLQKKHQLIVEEQSSSRVEGEIRSVVNFRTHTL